MNCAADSCICSVRLSVTPEHSCRRDGGSHGMEWKSKSSSSSSSSTGRETHLYHAHGQSRFLGQLLPNMACRFRCLIECRFQYLQLFGLDGGAGSASL